MISTILGAVALLFGVLAFVALVWAGLVRCPRCGGYCCSDTDVCQENRKRKGL